MGYNNSGFMEFTYWDVDSTGQIVSWGSETASGKKTGEMKEMASFEGWDFKTIWAIQENLTTPYLITLPEN